MKDADKAMKANPTGRKAGKYADEVNDAHTVLGWRKRNGIKEEVELDEGTKQVLAHGGKGQYKVVKDGDITKVMYKGKVVGTADFDRGADSFFVSIKGEKGQKSFDDAQAIADYFAKNKIKEEVELDERELTNTEKKRREEIAQDMDDADFKDQYGDRWKEVKMAVATKQAKNEELELDEGKMKELHMYIQQGKSAKEIAKIMKLDVKTIQALMAGYKESYELGTNEYRNYLEKLTPGEGTQEASASARAGADAARHIRRGKKEVDPADVDIDASPEDRAGADKNIIMQLRGVVSLKGIGKIKLTPQQARKLKKKDSKYLKTLGSGFVEFEKGHEKVDLKVAQAILNKFNSLKKPADKAKFQTKVAKSYKDMLTALKEEVELDEALPSHLQKHFDKDGNPKSKEGKAAWERLAKMKGYRKYTSKQIKMAIGIAFDKRFVQGNMTGAVNAIEKIATGLSEIEPVANALRRANEEVVNEGTWSIPKTSKQKRELKKLLSKPLKAKGATNKLYNIIGDDILFDDIDDFADTEPNADVRPMVRTAMKRLGIKEETILERIDRKLKERKNE